MSEASALLQITLLNSSRLKPALAGSRPFLLPRPRKMGGTWRFASSRFQRHLPWPGRASAPHTPLSRLGQAPGRGAATPARAMGRGRSREREGEGEQQVGRRSGSGDATCHRSSASPPKPSAEASAQGRPAGASAPRRIPGKSAAPAAGSSSGGGSPALPVTRRADRRILPAGWCGAGWGWPAGRV